jgi:hypothetical protein
MYVPPVLMVESKKPGLSWWKALYWSTSLSMAAICSGEYSVLDLSRCSWIWGGEGGGKEEEGRMARGEEEKEHTVR